MYFLCLDDLDLPSEANDAKQEEEEGNKRVDSCKHGDCTTYRFDASLCQGVRPAPKNHRLTRSTVQYYKMKRAQPKVGEKVNHKRKVVSKQNDRVGRHLRSQQSMTTSQYENGVINHHKSGLATSKSSKSPKKGGSALTTEKKLTRKRKGEYLPFIHQI